MIKRLPVTRKILLFVVLWDAAASFAIAQSQIQISTALETNREVLIHEALPFVPVTPEEKSKLQLEKEPGYLSATPSYGKVTIGNSSTKQDIAVVVDEAEGQRPRIYIDANNNRDLTDDGSGDWTTNGDSFRKDIVIRATFIVDGKGQQINLPYSVTRVRDERRKQTRILFSPLYARSGNLKLGNKVFRVLVETFSRQGLYSKPDDITIGIDTNQDGKVDRGLLSAEILWGGAGGGKPFNIDGESYRIAGATDPGDKIFLEVSPIKVAPKKYITVGEAAPDFDFQTLTDHQMKLSSLKGKVVLLDFWATWCGPCVANLPTLKDFYRQNERSRLEIVGISLDGGESTKTTRDDVVRFVTKEQINWPIAFDNKGWDNAIAILYNVTGIPIHVLVDQKGVVRLVQRSGSEEQMNRIRNMIADLVKEQ